MRGGLDFRNPYTVIKIRLFINNNLYLSFLKGIINGIAKKRNPKKEVKKLKIADKRVIVLIIMFFLK